MTFPCTMIKPIHQHILYASTYYPNEAALTGASYVSAKEREWEKVQERERALQLSDEEIQDPRVPSKVKAQVCFEPAVARFD